MPLGQSPAPFPILPGSLLRSGRRPIQSLPAQRQEPRQWPRSPRQRPRLGLLRLSLGSGGLTTSIPTHPRTSWASSVGIATELLMVRICLAPPTQCMYGTCHDWSYNGTAVFMIRPLPQKWPPSPEMLCILILLLMNIYIYIYIKQLIESGFGHRMNRTEFVCIYIYIYQMVERGFDQYMNTT